MERIQEFARMGKFNRTLVLIGLMGLAGWIAWLMATQNFSADSAAFIFGAAASPVAAYIGVKGNGQS